MKTYLFKFDTNYEEAGLIITTAKGEDHAKKQAKKLGAWDTNDIVVIDTETEGAVEQVNYFIKELP